jgi:hypothetical protein
MEPLSGVVGLAYIAHDISNWQWNCVYGADSGEAGMPPGCAKRSELRRDRRRREKG